MKPRHSFKSRTPPARDNQHSKAFPIIAKEVIDQADIILEVLDARFWKETRNHELEKEIMKQDKKIIYVFNKSDTVEKKEVMEQMGEEVLNPHIFISCKNRKGTSELRERIKIEAKKVKKNKIFVGLIGYPNTGKSSIVNILKGAAVARVASESGFTKGIMKVKIAEKIFLVDTPGVIPSNENSAIRKVDLLKHAQINVRTWDKVKDPEMIIHELMQKFSSLIEDFYGIEAFGNSEVLIEELGRKKRFLLKGDEVDKDKTARLIIRDIQERNIRL